MSVKLVYNNLPRISKEMEQNASIVVRTAAYRVEQISKASMSGPKHGRLYVRGRKSHRASAPGEPPAVDTGKLKNAIFTEMVTPLRARVTANTEYARILEMHRNRKFFTPALKQITEWFVKTMDYALGKVK